MNTLQPPPGLDVWMKWWQSMAEQAAAATKPPPPANPAEQAQKIFTDALSTMTIEYLRSPLFAETVRQCMAGAVSFQNQLRDYLLGTVQQSFAGHPAAVEGRLARRLDDLSQRLDRLESALSDRGAAGGSPGSRRRG